MVIASPGATLRDEQQVIDAIVALMKTEQQLLIRADADGLSTLTPNKLQLAQRAAALSRVRHKALAAAGFPAGEDGMAPWLAAGGSPAHHADWDRLLELTRAAKELNRVNGMLVNRQLGQAQAALNELRGPNAGAAGVYGKGGQTLSAGPSRRFAIG